VTLSPRPYRGGSWDDTSTLSLDERQERTQKVMRQLARTIQAVYLHDEAGAYIHAVWTVHWARGAGLLPPSETEETS